MAKPRKPSAYDRFRDAEIAKIHIGKSQLQLSEDIYRDIIREASQGKTESAADLDWRGRRAVLLRLDELGWKPRHRGTAPATPSRPLADDPQSKKIRALWIELHDAGRVRNPSEKALASYVKRMTGIAALQWLNNEQAILVIESLKKWLER